MLIVTPNLTTDRTIELDELVPGGVHRTRRAIVTLGGKGVNVARVGRALGRSAPVVGFVPSADAAELDRLAGAEGAELLGVPLTGRVRAATVLIERSGRVSVLNEPGPDVDEGDWSRLIEVLAAEAPEHLTLSCLGSLPPGSPQDGYARCIEVARRCGLRTIVDATGPVLEAALAGGPSIVTPNLAEAETVLSSRSGLSGSSGVQLEPSGSDVAERAAHAARSLLALGAERAVVTIGSYGAVLAEPGSVALCPAPEVEVVNPIGAGDSLVGGLVHALEQGAGFGDAVCLGVATAAASCEQLLAGGIDPRRVEALARLVGLRPIRQAPRAGNRGSGDAPSPPRDGSGR